jgi:hypothetical protein
LSFRTWGEFNLNHLDQQLRNEKKREVWLHQK